LLCLVGHPVSMFKLKNKFLSYFCLGFGLLVVQGQPTVYLIFNKF